MVARHDRQVEELRVRLAELKRSHQTNLVELNGAIQRCEVAIAKPERDLSAAQPAEVGPYEFSGAG